MITFFEFFWDVDEIAQTANQRSRLKYYLFLGLAATVTKHIYVRRRVPRIYILLLLLVIVHNCYDSYNNSGR